MSALVIPAIVAAAAGAVSWVAYLVFLSVVVVKRPEALPHIPGAVRAYRVAGVGKVAELLATALRRKRGS